MIFDLIFLILAALALMGIAAMIVRKFPVIARLNPDTLKERQESRLKTLLIEERLRRKTENALKHIREFVAPAATRFGGTITRGYQRLVELEKEYRKKNLLRPEKNMSALKHANELLDEVRVFMEEEEFSEAEKKCIEVIALDAKKEDAYELLGEVYMELKEFKQAKETFEYLVQLKKKSVDAELEEEAELSNAYLDLCLALKEVGDLSSAQEACTLAVQYDEKNPRNLSALLDVAMIIKDRLIANRTLDKLKEVNPENQKLEELEEKVKAL
ncbi:MAG: hypothetical protein WCV86_00020 [Patescibacteria group bacterium]|jgi:tetratricopeptide (TPR) repeat protein